MTTTANRSYRWLFWTLAILGLCLDQGSKYGVFAWLQDYPSNPYNDREAEVVPGVFYLSTTFTNEIDQGDNWRSPLRTLFGNKVPKVNHGALWGIGDRLEGTEDDFNHIFALVSVAAAVAIIFWSFRASTAQDCLLCMSLGLILAGTLGNLYDRVVFLGVRDFLQWVYLFNFPRFNIADSCLVCGAALLLLQAFFAAPAEQQIPAATVTVLADTLPADSLAGITQPLPEPATAQAK
jgi:signal peptidase II